MQLSLLEFGVKKTKQTNPAVLDWNEAGLTQFIIFIETRGVALDVSCVIVQ